MACSAEKFSEDESIEGNVKLKHEGELKLTFDHETSAYAYNVYRYDKFYNELLLLPQGVNKLKRHSPDTGELLGEIILEASGPNGIGVVDAANFMFEVIGKDSLLLYSDWNKRLILVNRNGEVLHKVNLHESNELSANATPFTKILYHEGKVTLFTYDNIRTDGSFNYEIDFNKKGNGRGTNFSYNKENLGKAEVFKENKFFEPGRTLNKEGELMVVFPFVDTIYTWSKNEIIKKGFTSGFKEKNRYPKSDSEFNSMKDKYGKREYLSSFTYNYNIEYFSDLGVTLVFSIEPIPLGTKLGIMHEAKRYYRILFFDNQLNMIGQDLVRAELNIATFFDEKYLYLASTENNFSEDELIYRKYAITQD